MTPDGMLELRDVARGALTLWRKAPGIARLVGTMALASDDRRLSLGRVLARTARRHPHRPAIKQEGGVLTWRELDRESSRVAHVLQSRGVRRGDAVAVALDNRPELLILVAAAAKLGAVASMINVQQRRAALLHSLTVTPHRCYVVGDEVLPAFLEVRAELPARELLRVADAGRAEPPADLDAFDLLAAARGAPMSTPAAARAVRMGDPLLYIFTSGTTGLPKASIMSHKRWLGAGLMFGAACLGLGPEDTLYAPLPLYHNQALTLCWSASVDSGAALAIRRGFSATAFWDDCRRHDATAIAYIGEICRYLLQQPPGPGDRDHRVRKAVGVGMRPELWTAFEERFGVLEIYEYYSASELNAGFFNILDLDHTVGICPVPWALVAWDARAGEPLRGLDGHLVRVGRGGTGLLVTRVTERFRFEGYTDQEATRSKLLHDVFAPGDTWIHTGDLMRSIGFGHLQFVDRVGDTFRWKGENVATTEVERVIATEPSVRDATVYGVEVPHASGRAGMAAAVPVAGEVDREALLARLRRELPAYAVPRFLREVRELEVTGTFKHVKHRLREEGFDPMRIGDPLYVLLPGASRYEPLTADHYADLTAARTSV